MLPKYNLPGIIYVGNLQKGYKSHFYCYCFDAFYAFSFYRLALIKQVKGYDCKYSL
jgi:hypothetical protein